MDAGGNPTGGCDTQDSRTPEPPEPIEPAAAYAELQHLILDGPDVTDFLQQLAALASAIVPGTHCGITLRRDGQIATVVSSDDAAVRMDEVQYLRGRGPCLAAIQEGTRIEVPDMEIETRWGTTPNTPRRTASTALSLPLTIDGHTQGALNLFATTPPHAFTDHDIGRAEAFTAQAATALTILLRHASHTVLDDELREALVTRAVIDQALGILMVTRKVSTIAAELIERMTGHPPEPPRPLTQRGP